MPNQLNIAELHFAADCIRAGASEAHDSDLFEMCAEGLRELADHLSEYAEVVTASRPFAKHLKESVQGICLGQAVTPGAQQEAAFALLEDLAVIFREATLCKGFKDNPEIAGRIMHYFESSGHWPTAGSLVADYYYTRIPVMVMHYLLERVQTLVDTLSTQAV